MRALCVRARERERERERERAEGPEWRDSVVLTLGRASVFSLAVLRTALLSFHTQTKRVCKRVA